MAAKMPDYSCEICGVEGFNDDEMRTHMIVHHLNGASSCPFCDLGDVSAEEMMMHVNSAHLDYLTPEQELLAFIDDDDDSEEGASARQSPWPVSPVQKQNGWANNINNNNNNYCTMMSGASSSSRPCTNGAGQGSPLRSQLALNLRTSASPSKASPARKPTPQQCPMCAFTSDSPLLLEEHINRQHFDLMSPSFPVASPPPREMIYNCPLCIRTFQNTPDLELHVNIEHRDILSPAKPTTAQSAQSSVENWTDSCPVCCLSNFKNNAEMVSHIEDHFNQKGMTPITPDVSSDRMLAREIEKRDREVRRLQEQREFELLRAQYGMDNQGNFKEQSLSNMQKAVYAGEMSVKDYYEKQIELRAAESNGIDDGSSCTKGLVPKIKGISGNSLNVIRTLMCTTVDHYASTYGDKGWGCGYRNTQMMLSSLLHHTGYNEQLYGGLYGMKPPAADLPSRPNDAPGRSAMPSISRLQQHIEWAWTQGFDVQGSDQLGGKLFNTRKWIGATEVVTVLSSLRIRCQLIDFHRPTSPGGAHPDLFNWVLQYFQKNDEFKPPLYLQHQGHSRTIVGVEQHKEGALFLIVFDPSHTPHQMGQFRNTATATAGMRLIRKSQAAMKAKQYQVVAVTGIMETDYEYQQSKLLRSVRVPQDR